MNNTLNNHKNWVASKMKSFEESVERTVSVFTTNPDETREGVEDITDLNQEDFEFFRELGKMNSAHKQVIKNYM